MPRKSKGRPNLPRSESAERARRAMEAACPLPHVIEPDAAALIFERTTRGASLEDLAGSVSVLAARGVCGVLIVVLSVKEADGRVGKVLSACEHSPASREAMAPTKGSGAVLRGPYAGCLRPAEA